MNRRSFLKSCLRGGLLVSLIGLGAVLSSRAEKPECDKLCGHCQKFKNGKCLLGIQ
ncbi:MAG: hypothetical protein MUC65_01995 [Pontiellaceae bacterium]|jgi:hypothetical protein|nr:hypothetical protein [Pontiellaceae bacterium]